MRIEESFSRPSPGYCTCRYNNQEKRIANTALTANSNQNWLDLVSPFSECSRKAAGTAAATAAARLPAAINPRNTYQRTSHRADTVSLRS